MLTVQKTLFCDYYLVSLNATEAAKLAGYESKKPEGVRVKACKLMQDKEIKEYIGDRLKHKQEGLIVKQDDILEYLSGCIYGTESEKQFIVLRSGAKGAYEDTLVERELPLKARDRIRAAEVMAKIYKLMDGYKDKESTIIINNTIPREG